MRAGRVLRIATRSPYPSGGLPVEQVVHLGHLVGGQRAVRQRAGVLLDLGHRAAARDRDGPAAAAPQVPDGALGEGTAAAAQDLPYRVELGEQLRGRYAVAEVLHPV